MLKKLRFLVFVGVLFVCSIPLAAGAYSTNFLFTADGNQYTSPYYPTAQNFDTSSPWIWTGSGAVVSGSLADKYSAPGGIDGLTKDTTKFVTVPNPSDVPPSVPYRATGGSLLDGPYTYFGLWWGSMDAYNTLTFYLGSVLTGESVTGADVIASALLLGDQLALGSNRYVNLIGLLPYDSFAMSSTNFAFEADNIAIGPVPEPTTMLLLGLGLLGVAGIRRKFKK